MFIGTSTVEVISSDAIKNKISEEILLKNYLDFIESINVESAYAGALDITRITSLSDANKSVVMEALQAKAHIEQFPLAVELEETTTDEIGTLTKFFNTLNLPSIQLLCVVTKSSDAAKEKLLQFLDAIVTPSVKVYSFKVSVLGDYHSEDIANLLAAFTRENCNFILRLEQTNLAGLGGERLPKFVEQLVAIENITHIALDANYILAVEEQYVDALYTIAISDGFMRKVIFSEEYDSTIEKLSEIYNRCKELGIGARRKITEMCLQAIVKCAGMAQEVQRCIMTGTRLEVKAFDFNLSAEDLYFCLFSVIKRCVEHEYAMYTVPYIVACANLPSKEKVELLQEMDKLGGGILYNSAINLDIFDKIKLYLHFCAKELDYFKVVPLFAFGCDDNLAAKILATWDNKAVVASQGQANESEQAWLELDVDYAEKVVAYATCSRAKLLEYCQGMAGKQFAELITKITQSIFKTTDIEGEKSYTFNEVEALHAYNMGNWVTWTCAAIAVEPQLVAKFKNAEYSECYAVHNIMFREITKLASPKMRFQVTLCYLELVRTNYFVEYCKLFKSIDVERYLPAVPLCMLEVTSSEGGFNLLRARQILTQIDSYKFKGVQVRVLMSAILTIYADDTVLPAAKLQIISQITAKSAAWESLSTPIKELHIEIADNFLTQYGIVIKNRKIIGELTLLEILVALHAEPECMQLGSELSSVELPSSGLGSPEKAILIFSMRERSLEQLLSIIERNINSALVVKIKEHLPHRTLLPKELLTFSRALQENVVPEFFKKTEGEEKITKLRALQGLSALGCLQRFGETGANNFITTARGFLQESFALTDKQMHWYQEYVENTRYETALLTYYAKLNSIPTSEKIKVLECLKLFVWNVSTENCGDFYRARYSLDNIHLQTVFAGRSELYAQWQQGKEANLSQFIVQHEIASTEYMPNFADFLHKKIFIHKHVDAQEYTILLDYLRAETEETKVALRIKALDKTKVQSQVGAAIAVDTISATHARIQLLLIQLLDLPIDKQVNFADRYTEHKRILRTIKIKLSRKNLCQFAMDIGGILKGLKSNQATLKQQDWTGYKIADTDKWSKMLMSGTDVDGSCQSVDADWSTNQCLLAYALDGKNRMLAIINQDDKIVARCILRVLFDENTKQAVLYREEFYPETIRSDLRRALEVFSVQRATDLGLTLLSTEGTAESCAYPGQVKSIFSPVPYEYVDAIGDKAVGGVFEISNSQIIYDASTRPTCMLTHALPLIFSENSKRSNEADACHAGQIVSRGYSAESFNAQSDDKWGCTTKDSHAEVVAESNPTVAHVRRTVFNYGT